MKLTTVTPGMAIGYWKARKRPRRARSSVPSGSRSVPSKLAPPAVTVYRGWPIRVYARVLFPDPLGPISAWTSPVGTRRSTPRRMGVPSTLAARPSTTRAATFSGMDGLTRLGGARLQAEGVADPRAGVVGAEDGHEPVIGDQFGEGGG